MGKRRVLSLCTHNSARSQMAEGFVAKTTRAHWGFEHPSRATGSEEDRLEVFRRVRDQIGRRLTEWTKAV